MTTPPAATIDGLRTQVYRFPTPEPESDGTLTWDATTTVVVHVTAAGESGLGWTYSTPATAQVINEHLAPVVRNRQPDDVSRLWRDMVIACRNLGRPGIVSQAIAAVDIALWDLRAKLAGLPLAQLFGKARRTVPVYGSGGFTSMTDDELREQVAGWLQAGCTGVKIKIGESFGSNVVHDLQRVALVRSIIPDDITLMVDANGGYTPGQARRLAHTLDSLGVTWFEEPVSSDMLDELALLRGQARCDIAAGEYADSVQYVQRMCAARAVDCLQIDVTRCAGYTEWVRCAAIAASYGLEVSGHCAPSLHAPVAAAATNLRHVEWFADHERLEALLVDGRPQMQHGALALSERPGHGMNLAATASAYRID